MVLEKQLRSEKWHRLISGRTLNTTVLTQHDLPVPCPLRSNSTEVSLHDFLPFVASFLIQLVFWILWSQCPVLRDLPLLLNQVHLTQFGQSIFFFFFWLRKKEKRPDRLSSLCSSPLSIGHKALYLLTLDV